MRVHAPRAPVGRQGVTALQQLQRAEAARGVHAEPVLLRRVRQGAEGAAGSRVVWVPGDAAGLATQWPQPATCHHSHDHAPGPKDRDALVAAAPPATLADADTVPFPPIDPLVICQNPAVDMPYVCQFKMKPCLNWSELGQVDMYTCIPRHTLRCS